MKEGACPGLALPVFLVDRETTGRFARRMPCFKFALGHAMSTRQVEDFMHAFSLNRGPMETWIRRRAYPSLEAFLDYRTHVEVMSPDWVTFMMQAEYIMTCLEWAQPDDDGTALTLHRNL